MVLSDFVGDTKNIETIFNPDYRFFGVRVQAHDLHDYCIVCIYAVDIYSTLKSALYTSANIDEEMLFERETLGRNIAQTNNYPYSTRFARDHPNVHLSMYNNSAQKSKRKVRLTEYQDGDTTMCVLRRDSLERNASYKNHDDVDYQYTNDENKRFTHVPDYERPTKRYSTMVKGERIVKQEIVDFDKETYSKHVDNGSMYSKHKWNGDPHSNRISVNNQQDYDTKLYYGNLNDISEFEERVVNRYTGIVPAGVRAKHEDDEYWRNEVSRGPDSLYNASLRKVKTPRRTVEEVLHQPENRLHREVQHPKYTFRDTHLAHAKNYDGIEVSYVEHEDIPVETSFRVTSNTHRPAGTSLRETNSNRHRPVETSFRNTKYNSNRPVEVSFREASGRNQVSTPNNYGRFTAISAIPRVSEHAGITRTSEFVARDEIPHQMVNNYQMVERDTLRSSRRSERATELGEPIYGRTTINRGTKGGLKFNSDFTADRSFAGRATAVSSARKTRMLQNDISPINNLDISSSFG
jgi:hypothetical protein